MDEELDDQENSVGEESICPCCGLRSYDDVCQNCGTSIVGSKDNDEDEEYNWREHKR